jgi:hypothetical protein
MYTVRLFLSTVLLIADPFRQKSLTVPHYISLQIFQLLLELADNLDYLRDVRNKTYSICSKCMKCCPFLNVRSWHLCKMFTFTC